MYEEDTEHIVPDRRRGGIDRCSPAVRYTGR